MNETEKEEVRGLLHQGNNLVEDAKAEIRQLQCAIEAAEARIVELRRLAGQLEDETLPALGHALAEADAG